MAPPTLWLARYRDLLPVRSRGSFHLVSVVRGDDPSRRTLVVIGSRHAHRDEVRRALDEIADAHERIDHPRVPKVVERGEVDGVPFLELSCDAIADGNDILRMLGDARMKLSYGQGDALFTTFREALQAGHRARHPRTGLPYTMGYLSYANILWSRSGKFWFVGFGHDFPVFREDGRHEGLGSVWQAPELLSGQPATPSSDYVAILMIARSLTAFCDLGEIVQRFLQVAVSPESIEAYETARWFETQFISQLPSARPSVEEGIARSVRVRQIFGVQLDVAGLEQRVATLIAEADGERPDVAEDAVVSLAGDGEWMQVGAGEPLRLGRAHQQILKALIAEHRARPGATLGVWQLLDAGWPGEDPIPEAGANRVYTAIARLRALGLRHLLERSGDGYRLSPTRAMKIVSSKWF